MPPSQRGLIAPDAQRVLIALGGNALSRRGEAATAEHLRANVRASMGALAEIARTNRLVVTHGNGPQVGLLALQNLAYADVSAYPLDILGAESQGMLGYVIEQELMNALHLEQEVVTVLTTTVVDPGDPAFSHPTKFVGPVYRKETAEEMQRRYGWTIAQDGSMWRRVVPSPEPRSIQQAATIKRLVDHDLIVLCAGGGGVPVIVDADTHQVRGTEAVIDKDLASAVLARDLEADLFVMLTDVDAVYTDWGTPQQQAIKTASPPDLERFSFAEGSMAPKVRAASRFAAAGGTAAIGSLRDLAEILAGSKGTRVTADAELTFAATL